MKLDIYFSAFYRLLYEIPLSIHNTEMSATFVENFDFAV